MKIQLLCGGLGNQIRHYIFVKFAEKYRPGTQWLFDDSSFWDDTMFSSTHDNDILDRIDLARIFGVKLNLLSQYYSPDVWMDIVRERKSGNILPQVLLNRGMPIVMFEGRLYVDQEPFSGKIIMAKGEHLGFHPEYIDLPYENIYYHAEWADKRWFLEYKENNIADLSFPELADEKNLRYADMIRGSVSIGIHVRRGDFIRVGWDVPCASYLEANRRVVARYPDAHFFVFSDDLEWCQANKYNLGFDLPACTTYIFGNSGKDSYIDMQLLSMCRGIVRNAESSFSQVAGWLDENLELEVKLPPNGGAMKWIETPKSL